MQEKAYNDLMPYKDPEERKQYYKRNKEKRAAYDKEYYANNKEKKAEYSRKYQKENPEKINEISAIYRKRHPERAKATQVKCRKNRKEKTILGYLELKYSGIPCMDCGRVFLFYAMDFDHRPEEVKSFGVSTKNNLLATPDRIAVLEKEIAKCDLVDATCHRIRTYERGK